MRTYSKKNEDLLRRYNQDEEIRPYLKNYPFTSKNLRIVIYLVDQKGIDIHNTGNSKEFLSAIYQSWGRVRYAIENDEKPNPQDIFEETYEEALSIVRNQNPDLFAE